MLQASLEVFHRLFHPRTMPRYCAKGLFIRVDEHNKLTSIISKTTCFILYDGIWSHQNGGFQFAHCYLPFGGVDNWGI